MHRSLGRAAEIYGSQYQQRHDAKHGSSLASSSYGGAGAGAGSSASTSAAGSGAGAAVTSPTIIPSYQLNTPLDRQKVIAQRDDAMSKMYGSSTDDNEDDGGGSGPIVDSYDPGMSEST